jgi:hypothetical protein
MTPGTGPTDLGKAVDDAAGGTDTGIATLWVRDDALSALSVAEGDYIQGRVDSQGSLWARISQITPGTGATDLGKAVDNAAGSTDTGVAALAVRKDTLTTITPVEGDYAGLLVNSEGALHIVGKVSTGPPPTPPATTAVLIDASSPLSIGGGTSPDDTTYTIPNGQTFTLQSLQAGSEGDSTESGSRVEVWYDDGTTEHLVTREYVSGFTVEIFPDTNEARDGTVMTGDGSTKLIIVRRERLSGGALEIDAVAKGYVS